VLNISSSAGANCETVELSIPRALKLNLPHSLHP